MSTEAIQGTLAIFVLLVVAVFVVENRSDGSATYCKAYANLWSRADVVEVDGATVLVNQGRRDPCGDNDLAHYALDDDIDGVLFDDCLISWVGGGRSPASIVGIA